MFDMRCQEHGIEHRFTRINHPWTNGQIERMNRTVKDATVKRFHYDSHDQLQRHPGDFVAAYNFARRRKHRRGRRRIIPVHKFSPTRWPSRTADSISRGATASPTRSVAIPCPTNPASRASRGRRGVA